MFLGGVVLAVVRRYIQRPYRIRIKSKPEHVAILGTFFLIGVSGYLAEMFRIAVEGRPGYEQWSFVGYPLSRLVDGWSLSDLQTWHQSMWIFHVAHVRRRSWRCCRSRCCATCSPRRSTCT